MIMNFNTPVAISLPRLKEFVYEAKRRAFASTDKKTTLTDQASVYSYRPFGESRFKGMIYADIYNGNTIEGGHESVTVDLVLRWRNQYYGGTKIDFWDLSSNASAPDKFSDIPKAIGQRFPELVSRFLKQALMNMPLEFPVRGPREFRSKKVEFEGIRCSGDWVYRNNWGNVRLYNTDDPFAAYVGQERISLNGTDVYWHAYHGGLVRDKYFPLVTESK